MDYFEYRNGELFCEDVPVKAVARKVGTPFYLYSYGTFERHFRVFDGAFADMPHLVCYSLKANSNGALVRTVAKLGGGADIVSGGELYRALEAGIPAERIVYSGVGKSAGELRYAIEAGIRMINIESEGEFLVLKKLSRKMKKKVPVSIRVNPEIDPKTHPYITTGLKKNKFGILWGEAARLYREIAAEDYLAPVGISSHIGSQILELGPFVEAVTSLKSMILELKGLGIAIEMLDIGGGLGISYKDELPPHPDEYARAVRENLGDTGITLIMEPGRVIVGNSGIFVARMLYVKRTAGKTFYIVDGAMNDLVRPSLYNAYHEILPVDENKGKTLVVDLVGPICESGDFFAKDRELADLKEGSLVAVKGAGAYGFAMSSNYNSRRRAAEVLVKGSEFYVVRKRETLKDLTRGESTPSFLEV
ncbi:MAG TPA: diaminopimelate decarboxylase [Deltaproteobacteria bacterium]|nr:diaminopimelate decarboxylase [Deltaproteobacteria bacterium]